MCKAIDDIADSRDEGKSEGRESDFRDSIRNVMESLHVSITKAMDIKHSGN